MKPELKIVAIPHLCLLVLISALLLGGCGSSEPEQIVAEFVTQTEEAIEARKGRAVRALISESYLDEQNRTKADLAGVATGYLLSNRSIYVLSRISEVIPIDEKTIQATVLAAFTGSPVGDAAGLPDINADIYWFDITIVEEDGDWKLSRAGWRQAMVEDFL
jgi:hypothetical protein